jgi:hypothetical protein
MAILNHVSDGGSRYGKKSKLSPFLYSTAVAHAGTHIHPLASFSLFLMAFPAQKSNFFEKYTSPVYVCSVTPHVCDGAPRYMLCRNMDIHIVCPLRPGTHTACLLKETMKRYNDACNFVAEMAFVLKSTNKYCGQTV